MRPKEAGRRISNLLWNRYIEKKQLKDKTLEDIKKDLFGIKDAILDQYSRRMADERRYEREGGSKADERSGYETYGYGTLEDIKGNLEYISDRYNCAFRLRWLIDLMELEECEPETEERPA